MAHTDQRPRRRDRSAAVAAAIAGGTVGSTVNLAEVLSRAADRGADAASLADDPAARGLLGGAIRVESFTAADAVDVARRRPLTRTAGLSLGERAGLALALARRRGAPVVAAETAWAGTELAAGVELTQIR